MTEIIDAIFDPAAQLLANAAAWLRQASAMAARGLDLRPFLAYYSWLPAPWLQLLSHVVAAALVVAVAAAGRAAWALYLRFKESVQWW